MVEASPSRSRKRQVDLCVVSGATRFRYPSFVNHRIYALRHGYDFRMEYAPYADLRSAYFLKVSAVKHVLPRYDWVFWIDDDAFFTDFDIELSAILRQHGGPDSSLVICRSPVNEGKWTFLSSGQFFIRNSPQSFDLLDRWQGGDLEAIRAWWQDDRHGLFTNTDQDVLTYLLHVDPRLREATTLLDYHHFNCRPFHYAVALREHFVCHFAVFGDKGAAIRRFSERFGLDDTLVPAALKQGFELYDRTPPTD